MISISWLPLPLRILLPPLPMTLVCFALLAYLPGLLLVRPFTKSFCGSMRSAAALLLGWAFYTFFADATLKWFGPTIWGFYLAPGALTWLSGIAIWFSSPMESTNEEPAVAVTGKQALFASLLGVVAVMQVIPIEWNSGVFWGTPEIDWRSRLPVTNAVARDGLPAANPFFNPDGDSKLFFYYGFFLLPAASVRAVTAARPGHLEITGLETVGVMCFCVFLVGWMVALFAMALGNNATGDRRGGWISGFLCYVTGLDLLPVLALTLRGTTPSSIEWWNPAQITAVHAFPVWVPHHTLAALDVVLAHILAWKLSSRTAVSGIGVLSILLASAAMTSTYVAMLGFLSIFIHGTMRAYRPGSRHEGALPMTAAILGGILVLPFYYQLSKIDEYRGPSIQPIIRPSPSEEPIRDSIASTLHVSPPVALFITRIAGLIPQYFFELGILFFVLVYWRRTGIGRYDSDGLWNRLGVMVVVAFVVGSIFVSVRTWNCDLNWRIMHPVQIALLGAAPAFFREFHSKPRPMFDKIGLALFVLIGLAGSGYDFVRTRLDYLRQPGMGERGAFAVDAARQVNHFPSGKFAVDPRNFGDGYGNPFFVHLLRRRLVLSDDSFNAFPYGPHPDRVRAVIADVTEAFQAKTSRERRLEIFKRYNVAWVLIDKRSELFNLDVKATFGEQAREQSDASGVGGWKAIDLHERRNFDRD